MLGLTHHNTDLMDTSATPTQDKSPAFVRASRFLWLLLVAGSLLLMLAAAPQRYAMLLEDTYGFGTAVTGLGLTYPAFALYFTSLELFTGLACLLVATLIAWRRPGEWALILFAATFGSFCFLMPLFDALSRANPAWQPYIVFLRVLVSTGFFATLCLFPDGRFVPSWSRWYLLAWALFVLLAWPALSSFLASTAIIPQTRTLADGLGLMLMAFWALLGLLLQAIRYRSYASAEQRQQTKWVLYGFFVVAGAALVNALLLTLIPALREDPRQNLLFTLSMGSLLLLGTVVLVFTVALAILRYRLWDIDILINRTLLYGGLTLLITAAYVVLVGGLGALSRGNAGYVAGAALATALVAVLLRPAAARWQTAVDRLLPANSGAVPLSPSTPVARSEPPLRAVWWGVVLLAIALLLAGLAAWRAAGYGWLELPAAWPGGEPFLLQAFVRFDPPVARALLIGTALQGLIFVACGLFLYLRKRGETMVVLASLMLIAVGLGFTPVVVALPLLRPAWHVPVTLFQALMFGAVILFLYLFPNGRFYPRWTRAAAFVWGAYSLTWLLWPGLNPHRSAAPWPLLIWGAWVGSGILAQLLRYRRGATPVEKQQAKWVIAGFIAANLGLLLIVGLVALNAVGRLAGATGTLVDGLTGLFGLGATLIPVTVAVALLRYRLWDIDLVINRSLVYGGLTALVLASYVLLVGGLSTLFQAQNELLPALLVTGLIAVLFQPLRAHLQRGVNRLMFGARDDPYGLLADLGRHLRAAGLPEQNLRAITDSICAALKLPYAAIDLAARSGRRTAARCGEPRPAEEWPLLYQGELVGWLVAAPRAPEDRFDEKERKLLETIAAQAGAAAYTLRLQSALQRSREQLVLAREEERRRLRRDLHDGLGPSLASQTFALEAALEQLEADPQAARALLAGLKSRNRELVGDIRRLVYELRPPALDQLGLAGALSAILEQNHGPGAPRVTLTARPDPLPPLSAAVEVAAYYIVREALTNIQHHAAAAHGRVTLRVTAQQLSLQISDDGRGLPAQRPSGVGLQSMRERAEELGGTFTVRAWPGGGTQLTALLPLLPAGEVDS